jgi:hypothetical protein
MNMHQLSGLDGLNNFADDDVVLGDGISNGKIAKGNFVAEWNRLKGGGLNRRIVGEDFSGAPCSGVDIDDRDADIVLGIVYEKMNHDSSLLRDFPLTDLHAADGGLTCRGRAIDADGFNSWPVGSHSTLR